MTTERTHATAGDRLGNNAGNRKRPPGYGGGGRGRHFAEVQHADDPVQTVKRLLSELKSRRKAVFLLLIPVLAAIPCGAALPKITGDVIDAISASASTGHVRYFEILSLLGIGLAVFAVQQVCGIIRGLSTNNISNETVRDMRAALFAHIQSLPVGDFGETSHGEYMSRLTNDVDMVANTLGEGIARFFETILTLVFILIYMIWLSPLLTLVTCSTLPLTFIMGRTVVAMTRKIFRERQRRLGEFNGFVEESVSFQHTSQAFCREEILKAQFMKLSDGLRDIGVKAETLAGIMGPVMNMVNNLSFIIVAAFGGWLAVSGDVSIGVVVAFMLYSRNFGRPVNELANQFNAIQTAIAGAERVFRLMDKPSEPDDGTIDITRDSIHGKIVFDNVSFEYVPGVPVLKDFSLEIPAGSKIAIVGETGSGKTTLINLLTRFYEPASGRICLDGVDIRSISKKSLRSCLTAVLQDVCLFNGTIRENIAFSSLQADNASIEAAAKLAGIDIFIKRMPQGYDTKINSTDTALSQGQCQLLSIARAALADPPILILDEATSNVDTRTELHIQRAMMRLLEGRTGIIIAHRLSTIRNADRIIVLQNGRIVENGTHKELIAAGGVYAKMCETQNAPIA